MDEVIAGGEMKSLFMPLSFTMHLSLSSHSLSLPLSFSVSVIFLC